MPTYYDIYNKYIAEYDELVKHEDYQDNLQKTLLSLFDWKNKTVIEAGIGTGRVTSKYIPIVKSVCGLDRAENMLQKAEKNLTQFLEKIEFKVCDNLNLASIKRKYDVFIEGWAFGHTVSDSPESINNTVELLINQVLSLLNKNGDICFIETLGTNYLQPEPPNNVLSLFYNILEKKHGFNKVIIDTSYRFENNNEAQRIMGFFFGQDMKDSVKNSGKNIIPEWTGLWYKKK